MADARVKAVYKSLLNLYERAKYGIDLATTSLREPLGRGDTVEVPYLGDLTVTESGATTTSPQAVTTNVIALVADKEPWINALLPALASLQLMDGGWADQVATTALQKLRAKVDSDLWGYVARYLCASSGTGGAYNVNPASNTLESADILNAKAMLESLDGVMPQNIALLMHPFGEASIRSIATFVPNFQQAELGALGIPRLGTVHGVPVYTTNSVPRRRTFACTAVSISTNVATVTAAAHGLNTGEQVTIAGITTPLAAAAAVTVVDANTFTVALTAGDGAMADGVGTVTVQACQNIMLDTTKLFTAVQKLPTVRLVPDFNSTGDALQVSTVWGRLGYGNGYAVTIDSPPASI